MELKQLLVERDYRPGMIDAAISKARAVPRAKALKHVVRKVSERRPVLWSPTTLDSPVSPVSQLFSINIGGLWLLRTSHPVYS